jgi:hypothetical protein
VRELELTEQAPPGLEPTTCKYRSEGDVESISAEERHQEKWCGACELELELELVLSE